ncbi:MAG: DCC1-like thiol-disulfide oxidoreductase family protein [Planctomycetota bacterium]
MILYDGSCGFCQRFVQFVLARDTDGTFCFAPLQDPGAQRLLDRYGKDAAELSSSYVLVGFKSDHEHLLAKGRGGLFVLKTIGLPWSILALLRFLPTALLDWGYDLVARNRNRFSGRPGACSVPKPEHRSRFLTLLPPPESDT